MGLPGSPMKEGVSSLATCGLVKVYGSRRVVDGIDLKVEGGEIIGLLGPNGAGKTTTFYMIVGLIPATGGSVILNELNITAQAMYRRARLGLGFLPQEASVFRRLTVEENLRAVAETLSLSRPEREELIERHLEELSLQHLRRQRAFTLSGGERRRLEIVRALLTGPKFLLMDEPFNGVDPISVHDVQEIIVNLKNRGIGVLVTDHNVRETLRIVDRAYLMHEGRVLSEGSSEFLINDGKSRQFYLGENFDL